MDDLVDAPKTTPPTHFLVVGLMTAGVAVWSFTAAVLVVML